MLEKNKGNLQINKEDLVYYKIMVEEFYNEAKEDKVKEIVDSLIGVNNMFIRNGLDFFTVGTTISNSTKKND